MAEKKKEEQAVVVSQKKELVLEGDPEQQLEYAHKAAKALMKVVGSKPNKVIINGKQYLEYGDWQTLARFFGATAGIEWARPIIDTNNKLLGYEARAVIHQHGNIISSAEASCMKTERRWAGRDEFALKSMAQTRAAAKALRNAFGWVAELAGYSGTPAEEMTYDTSPVPVQAEIIVSGTDTDEIPDELPRKKPEVNRQKARIKELCDDYVADDTNLEAPLITGDDYKTFVKNWTGLELVEENYSRVIQRLEEMLEPKLSDIK